MEQERSSHRLRDLMSKYMHSISVKCKQQPQLVLALWPKVIGEQFAPMTKAIRFDEGILYVTVSNSTLLSILSRQSDKVRLIKALQELVPGQHIRTINFRIG